MSRNAQIEAGMNMSLFESKMTELDRQVLETSAANKNLASQRLRLLAGALVTGPAPRAPRSEGDDLLFKKVPI